MAALEKISRITGTGVYVPGDDIDTDRIIPARFMKCVTFDGLGEYLFHDVRFHEDGTPKKHNLTDARFADATIIVSGANFGCGSSREHAPQAIAKAGYRGMVAGNFAEIFFGNATTLGIPCLAVDLTAVERLAEAIERDPSIEIILDVADRAVRFGGDSVPAQLRDSARESLLNGTWDPITQLLESTAAVEQRAGRLAYMGT